MLECSINRLKGEEVFSYFSFRVRIGFAVVHYQVFPQTLGKPLILQENEKNKKNEVICGVIWNMFMRQACFHMMANVGSDLSTNRYMGSHSTDSKQHMRVTFSGCVYK